METLVVGILILIPVVICIIVEHRYQTGMRDRCATYHRATGRTIEVYGTAFQHYQRLHGRQSQAPHVTEGLSPKREGQL